MSALLYWTYLTTPDTFVHLSGSPAVLTALTRAFGESPWRLDARAVPMLSELHAAHVAEDPNPFGELLTLLEQGDGLVGPAMRVWPQY